VGDLNTKCNVHVLFSLVRVKSRERILERVKDFTEKLNAYYIQKVFIIYLNF
jgi:hypothetical protein